MTRDAMPESTMEETHLRQHALELMGRFAKEHGGGTPVIRERDLGDRVEFRSDIAGSVYGLGYARTPTMMVAAERAVVDRISELAQARYLANAFLRHPEWAEGGSAALDIGHYLDDVARDVLETPPWWWRVERNDKGCRLALQLIAAA